MRNVEHAVASAEQLLNPFDWVPVIASFSGMVRILAGAVEVAAGAVFAVMKICAIIWTGEGKYWGALKQGAIYSLHGIANIARGCLAMLPGFNLLLFVHDAWLGRMNYEQETVRPGVYPLMTAHRLVVHY